MFAFRQQREDREGQRPDNHTELEAQDTRLIVCTKGLQATAVLASVASVAWVTNRCCCWQHEGQVLLL
jgi:hypothetical protein